MAKAERRREIKFQNHLIDSYKRCGGHARKWATEMLVGMPDLIATTRWIGCHLAEVKHRPLWSHSDISPRENPLTRKQRDEARKYIDGGTLVCGYVVTDAELAEGSYLIIFDPLCDEFIPATQLYTPYQKGVGYDVYGLTRDYRWCRWEDGGLDREEG